jgi:hypothetical protein
MMLKIFLVALVAMMAATAQADGGPCQGGFWPDGDGCCPELINNAPYYRAFNTKCYPTEIGNSIFYADSNGCYPNNMGIYQPAGQSCPANQQCHPSCIQPGEECHQTTTQQQTTMECPQTTTKQQTTTQQQTSTHQQTSSRKHHHHSSTTQQRTTTQERTTTPQRTTTEERTTTPMRTTTEERTTTPMRTTTEERTTTQERTTSPEHTTRKHHSSKCHPKTTTEKPCDDGKCSNGQWKDGYDCCPRKIGDQFYYRDGQGCYPVKRDCGVFYADGNGCYPDEDGKYLNAGDCCPKDRRCEAECDY